MSKAPDPLKAYREEKKLTQEALADLIGVSRALVSMLEIGEREYTAELAVQIEEKIGIPRARFRPDLFEQRAA